MSKISAKNQAYINQVAESTKDMEFLSFSLCPGCRECANDYSIPLGTLTKRINNNTIFDEGEFTWSGCQICKNGLGCTVFAGHARVKRQVLRRGKPINRFVSDLVHFEACPDCICYLDHGALPDD